MENLMNHMFLYRADPSDVIYRYSEILCKPQGAYPEEEVYQRIHELIEMAASHGFYGNLYHALLTNFIVNHENAFTRACEMRGDCGGSLSRAGRHDLELFMKLFHLEHEYSDFLDFSEIALLTDYRDNPESGYLFNKRIRDCIMDLCHKLEEAVDLDTFAASVLDFYQSYGIGTFGLHKAFRVDEQGNVVPITRIAHVSLSDLVGYEYQKKQLVDNTEAFLKKLPANNALLFGDAGTGKSTSIKAIINQYYGQGLRMIEIFKHQFRDLNKVIGQIKNRNYRFIIYMDDLSFEEFETDYKYLKAVIEGGLEKKPDNVLIYATSNRRHLVRESAGDKKEYDDLHKNDTVQEKLSLSYRFGCKIYYDSPSPKGFQEIVLRLRDRAGLKISDEEVLLEANQWELSHGGLSGRTAQQFIDDLSGKIQMEEEKR